MNSRLYASTLISIREIDRGLIIGALLCALLIVLGITVGGAVSRFINGPGLFLVLGGTIGAALIHFSLKDLDRAWKALQQIIVARDFNPAQRIRYLVRLAHEVRAHGPLVLEREARRVDDGFLKMALELTVDNQPPEDIRRILETERRTANEHAARAVQVFETMGTYAPALGLIGTLIGLIKMLGALDHPATVGPAMSLALVTTLYGVLCANLFFLPLAGKLLNRSEEQALIKSLTIEGTLSLGRQESPIILEQRLQSFLPDRVG